MLAISGGFIERPVKLVIYGPEGIGKSTLASKAPGPLFIDTEGGTAHLNVRRLSKPRSWDELLANVKEIAAEKDICSTLVLDTADWAEQMCSEGLCRRFNKKGIEEFGFGKGYVYLAEEFGRLLEAFDMCIESGKNVIVTAHAKMRKFEQPDEMGAYDRWEMKLSKQVAPLLKEWCDDLLFLNYKTFVVTAANDSKKVQGGKRVIYASHHPCWDGKNRHGLPDEMELSFEAISPLFGMRDPSAKPQDDKGAKKPGLEVLAEAMGGKSPDPSTAPQGGSAQDDKEARAELARRMSDEHIADEELRKIVSLKGHFKFEVPVAKYPEKFIEQWILPNWRKIVDLIEEDPHHLPF